MVMAIMILNFDRYASLHAVQYLYHIVRLTKVSRADNMHAHTTTCSYTLT